VSRRVTFFRGTTADGDPWVISWEGGPTALALEPEVQPVISGRVGPTWRVEPLTPAQASELRALLPHVTLGEVGALVQEVLHST